MTIVIFGFIQKFWPDFKIIWHRDIKMINLMCRIHNVDVKVQVRKYFPLISTMTFIEEILP